MQKRLPVANTQPLLLNTDIWYIETILLLQPHLPANHFLLLVTHRDESPSSHGNSQSNFTPLRPHPERSDYSLKSSWWQKPFSESRTLQKKTELQIEKKSKMTNCRWFYWKATDALTYKFQNVNILPQTFKSIYGSR